MELWYGQPVARKQAAVLLGDDVLMYLVGAGVCVYDVASGVQRFHRVGDGAPLAFVVAYAGEALAVSESAKFYLLTHASGEIAVKLEFALPEAHKRERVLKLAMNDAAFFAFTYNGLIAFPRGGGAPQMVQVQLAESAAAIGDVLAVGGVDNYVQLLRFDSNARVIAQSRFLCTRATGDERRPAVTALALHRESDAEITLLASQLYGASLLYRVDTGTLNAELLFELSKPFFGQTLANHLSAAGAFVAGANKQVRIFDRHNHLVQTVGQDFEAGCGIVEIVVSDSTLLVLMEAGRAVIFRLVDDRYVRAPLQLAGAQRSTGVGALRLGCGLTLHVHGRRVTVLDRGFRNLEVAVDNGSQLYGADAVGQDTFVTCGDENQLRIFTVPYYLALLHPNIALREGAAEAVARGEYPVQGQQQALDPTVAPVYIHQRVGTFQECQSAVTAIGVQPCSSAESQQQTTALRAQFLENALFPETKQLVGFAGASVRRVRHVGGLLYALSVSGRPKEASFRVMEVESGREVAAVCGVWADFAVFGGRAVLAGPRGAVQVLRGAEVISKAEMGFRGAPRVAASEQGIFLACGATVWELDWDLQQKAVHEVPGSVTTIEAGYDAAVVGLEDGTVASIDGKHIAQLSGPVKSLEPAPDMLLAMDTYGLAWLGPAVK